jgi:antitoxin PrlF
MARFAAPWPVAVARIHHPWHPCLMDATLVLGQQGRLVIPAEVRSALGLSPGDRLHLRLVGHSLVLERPQDAASELRGLASHVPRARSLVDELLTERRHAAAAGE